MCTKFDSEPYLADDMDDAEREARARAFRTKRPYFWGARTCVHGVTEWIAAPLADFKQLVSVGWLMQDTCGTPRRPDEDTSVRGAGDYMEAWGEAMYRVHAVKIATGIAVREDGRGHAFLVFPLDQRLRFESVGWEMCEEFHPE